VLLETERRAVSLQELVLFPLKLDVLTLQRWLINDIGLPLISNSIALLSNNNV